MRIYFAVTESVEGINRVIIALVCIFQIHHSTSWVIHQKKLKGLLKACVGWGAMGWVHRERKAKGCSSCPKDHRWDVSLHSKRFCLVLFPVMNGFKVNSRTDEKKMLQTCTFYCWFFFFFCCWSWIYNHGSDAWKTDVTLEKEWNLQHTVRPAAAHAPEAR